MPACHGLTNQPKGFCCRGENEGSRWDHPLCHSLPAVFMPERDRAASAQLSSPCPQIQLLGLNHKAHSKGESKASTNSNMIPCFTAGQPVSPGAAGNPHSQLRTESLPGARPGHGQGGDAAPAGRGGCCCPARRSVPAGPIMLPSPPSAPILLLQKQAIVKVHLRPSKEAAGVRCWEIHLFSKRFCSLIPLLVNHV